MAKFEKILSLNFFKIKIWEELLNLIQNSDPAMEIKFCENCEHPLIEAYKYCPECGQKINDKLNISVLFRNTISNFLSIDAKIFRSLFPLIFKPGFLATKFIEGKRVKYLHPAQFYLSVSVVFFFLFSFTVQEEQLKADNSLRNQFEHKNNSDSLKSSVTDSIDAPNNSNNIKFSVTDSIEKNKSIVVYENDLEDKKLDSLIAINAPEDEMLKVIGYKDGDNSIQRFFYAKILKFYKQRGSGILTAFYSNIPMSLFFLMPLFAFLLKLFFYKKGQYAHHLVFTFYFFTFLFTVFIGMLILNYIANIPEWIVFIVVCMITIHLIIGMMKFYKQKFFVVFGKTAALLFSFTIFVLPISVVLMALLSIMMY